MKTYAIIPARLDSKRLPNKMVLDETGKPLFVHTAENAAKANFDEVIIATPDLLITELATKFGFKYIWNRGYPLCGSHNCMMAASSLGRECNIVNIQGDCPTIDPEALNKIIRCLNIEISDDDVYSLYYPTNDQNVYDNSSNVKVATNWIDYAYYFSRNKIPYGTDEYKIHVGVYGFKYDIWTDILHQYDAEKECYEVYNSGEKLEQLMWLDIGYRMKLFECSPCLGIDTRSDYDEFKRHILQSDN